MKVTSITIEVARTVNTGNYNSVRIGLSETLEFDEPVEHASAEHKEAYREGYKSILARVNSMAAKYEQEGDA